MNSIKYNGIDEAELMFGSNRFIIMRQAIIFISDIGGHTYFSTIPN